MIIFLLILIALICFTMVALLYKLVNRQEPVASGQGAIAYSFFLRYSDEKMRTALMMVGGFGDRIKQGATSLEAWKYALDDKEDWALELDEARRIVKYFYRDLAVLHKAQCIDYNLVKEICSAGGIFLFIDYVLPMDELTNTKFRKGEFSPIPEIKLELENGII